MKSTEATRNLSKTSPMTEDSRNPSKESVLDLSRTSSKDIDQANRKSTKRDFLVGAGDGVKEKVNKKKKRKRSKDNVVYITVPESVMLGFNPRTTLPWGFDSPCSDGAAKFVMPPGFEFDTGLEERVHDLNHVAKPHMALANILSILTIVLVIYLLTVWQEMLKPMTLMIVLADIVTLTIGFPVFNTVRFTLKGWEMAKFVRRLDEHVNRGGQQKGCVHFERLEYTRWGVWDAAFVGTRTGFTQRTAIAVELFLDNPEEMLEKERLHKARESRQEELKNMDSDSKKFFKEQQMKEQALKTLDPALLVDPAQKTNEVIGFLQELHLVRLAPTVRKHRLDFADMESMTDQDWRVLGIDRTERKLIRVALEQKLVETGKMMFSQVDPVNMNFSGSKKFKPDSSLSQSNSPVVPSAQSMVAALTGQ